MWVCKICDWKRDDEPMEDWDTCPNCDSFEWMQEGERNDKKWTTDPPTEPGWYWAIGIDGEEPKPVKVELSKDNIWVQDWDEDYDGNRLEFPSMFTHWLGPLPVPERPKA